MAKLNRREFVHRGVAVGGAAAVTLSPWAARIASAATPALNTSRRATCLALAEVVADHPAADNDARGAVEAFARSWNAARSPDQDTMIQVIDAVETCVPNGGFTAASKRERAAALQANLDDLCSGPLPPGSKAQMVDAGLSGVARFMVSDYSQISPRPVPAY